MYFILPVDLVLWAFLYVCTLATFSSGLECDDSWFIMFQYVDQSVTLKACAGLNGMKLGGQVLTVVQAIPNALAMVFLHSHFFLNL